MAAQNNPALFKCRRCRQFVFTSENILAASILPEVGGPLWYINDDAQPLWIQQAIQEAQWTRGKLACPHCGGHLGSFDYVTPSFIFSPDYHGPWSCVQIIRKRVDCEMFVMTNLGSRMTFLAAHAINHNGGYSSCVNNTGSLVQDDDHGALPHGCRYLKRHELDTAQASCVSQNCNVNPTSQEYDNKCPNVSPGEARYFNRDVVQTTRPSCVTQNCNVNLTSQEYDKKCPNVSPGEARYLNRDVMETTRLSCVTQNCNVNPTSQEYENLQTGEDNERCLNVSPEEADLEESVTEVRETPERTGEPIISRDENEIHNNSRLDTMSTSSRKAELRAKKKEKNRRKNSRRKLRKQERWKDAEEAEREELLLEEEKLQSNPDGILGLFDICQSSSTIREALTCPICLDLYFNPHVCLPCRHIFCELCLRQLAQTTRIAPCPLCRVVIQCTTLQCELTAAIVEMIPRMTEQRKQDERKSRSQYYPLPGRNMNGANHFMQQRRPHDLVELIQMLIGVNLSENTLKWVLLGLGVIFMLIVQSQSNPR